MVYLARLGMMIVLTGLVNLTKLIKFLDVIISSLSYLVQLNQVKLDKKTRCSSKLSFA